MFTAGDLSWSLHVDKITAKVNLVLVLVKRTCRDLKDTDTMKTLYCSLVTPLLVYSWETWKPHTKRNIDKLEAVQRRATRWIILGLMMIMILDYLSQNCCHYLIGASLEMLHN